MTELVILEDAPARLELFRLELAGVDFDITDDVLEFIELVRAAEAEGTLKLIIMDHDLGHAKDGGRRLNFDKNGLSGTEAADLLETQVPVLIWSANAEGAIRMRSTLRRKGVNAVYTPIYDAGPIAAMLRSVFPVGASKA